MADVSVIEEKIKRLKSTMAKLSSGSGDKSEGGEDRIFRKNLKRLQRRRRILLGTQLKDTKAETQEKTPQGKTPKKAPPKEAAPQAQAAPGGGKAGEKPSETQKQTAKPSAEKPKAQEKTEAKAPEPPQAEASSKDKKPAPPAG